MFLVFIFKSTPFILSTMCGIIAYIGSKRREAPRLLFDGLRRLEYRGYDSWGMALIGNPSIEVHKRVGAITEARFLLNNNGACFHAVLGHTRWATHGGVSEKNAHPHLDCTGKIAVVHNGIIDNYLELKEMLLNKGHVFTSDTDTEVVPHLIEEEMKSGKSFGTAFLEAIKKLEGSYAIISACKDSRALLCAKKDSPLVIGVASHGYFVASDPVGFLEHTRDVIFLDDHELAVVTPEGVSIFDFQEEKIKRKQTHTIDWDLERVEKHNYPYFMEKEIMEQKETVVRAVLQSEDTVKRVVDMFNNAYGVFFVACGSSYYAALASSYIFSKVARKHINMVDASEFKYYKDFITPKTLVVAISQSGETADVLDAVKTAKKKKAKILAITNVMGSTLMRLSDFTVHLNCGPEICVVSTKAFTAQLAILELIAHALMDKEVEVKRAYREVSRNIEEILNEKNRAKLDALAKTIKDKEHVFCIGRGVSHAIALEAALKIKEVTYIHAEGFAGGALKHGPLALIEEGTPCVVFAPDDETYDDIISNATEIKSRGGMIIGVGSRKHDVFDSFIKVPSLPFGTHLLSIIPIQYLAYRMAVLRGLNPDKPRNLAKSVTVK